MNQITITVPPMFLPVLDEIVAMTQAGSREQWLTNVARGVIFDYQTRKDFAPQFQARIQQLTTFWPGPSPLPGPLPFGAKP